MVKKMTQKKHQLWRKWKNPTTSNISSSSTSKRTAKLYYHQLPHLTNGHKRKSGSKYTPTTREWNKLKSLLWQKRRRKKVTCKIKSTDYLSVENEWRRLKCCILMLSLIFVTKLDALLTFVIGISVPRCHIDYTFGFKCTLYVSWTFTVGIQWNEPTHSLTTMSCVFNFLSTFCKLWEKVKAKWRKKMYRN